MRTLTILVLILLSCGPGCINEPVEDSIVIKSGTTFGFCLGYCSLEATIIENDVRYIESSRDTINYPAKFSYEKLGTNEWDELLETIDMDKFEKLDEVIGCPDCADGGSEWIEIKFEDRIKKVTFESGHSIEGMEDLVKKLRNIRNRYMVD